MKNKFYFFAMPIAVALFIVFFAGTMNNGGSPGGKTGSPADVNTCSQCHGGTPTPQTGWITTDIPGTGYEPGQVYTITLTATDATAAKLAFELTAEDDMANKTGTFTITNATETKLVNSNAAVTHKAAGTTPVSGSKSWSCEWTAPSAGTGTVTFYAAINAANGNGNTSGDVIHTSMLSVNETTVSVRDFQSYDELNVFPNPSEGIFRIDAPFSDELCELTVVSAAGTILVNKKASIDAGMIDLSDLSPGVYFLNITAQEKRYHSKIVIR